MNLKSLSPVRWSEKADWVEATLHGNKDSRGGARWMLYLLPKK